MNNPYFSSTYDEYKARQLKQRTGQNFLNDTGTNPQLSQNFNMVQPQQPAPQGGFDASSLNQYGALANTVSQIATSAYNAGKPDYQSQNDKNVDAAGTSIASAIGPWWGALANVGTTASKSIKGDSTNTFNTTAGTVLDPFNQFKGSTSDIAMNLLTGKNTWEAVSGRTSRKARAAINARHQAVANAQLAANAKERTGVEQQNQLEEYQKRLNSQNRMNNLYSIPKSYQQMF